MTTSLNRSTEDMSSEETSDHEAYDSETERNVSWNIKIDYAVNLKRILYFYIHGVYIDVLRIHRCFVVLKLPY